MQFRTTPLLPVVGLVVLMGMVGCSRQDESAEEAVAAGASATPAAPKVLCHPDLVPMLDALPSSPVNGTALAKRECHNGVVTVRFGKGGEGQRFSYAMSTFRLQNSGLKSLSKIEGQKILDKQRALLDTQIKAQQAQLANARNSGGAVGMNLTQEQRDRLPHETRLPTGDTAIVFSEDGQHWRLISRMTGDRALEINWTDSRKPSLRTDEAVVEVLALAAYVRYEQLLP